MLVRVSESLRFVGVDIGATSLTVALTDGHLRVLGVLSEPIDVRSGPVPVLETTRALVRTLRAEHAGQSVTLTLRSFREREEAGGHQVDLFDVGGCGCFVDEGDAA